MNEIIPGLADCNGRCVETGQRVRFRYRRWEEDGHDGVAVIHEAEGEIRMSPFRGAYIVRHPGHVHRVYRATWFEVIDP